MKRLFSQSALWTVVAAMFYLPLSASATPTNGEQPSSVSRTNGSGQGEMPRMKRRHRLRAQGQVAQNPPQNDDVQGRRNGQTTSQGDGGWFDRQAGSKQPMSPADREARRERRRQRQGMENGSSQGQAGDRESRRRRRQERQARGQRSGNGAPAVSQSQRPGRQDDASREARRQRRLERQGLNSTKVRQNGGVGAPAHSTDSPARNPDQSDD
jgi:hypothetical protein